MYNPNRIAIIADFDKTLSPCYMQTPIFEHYNVDEVSFWRECNRRAHTHPSHNLSPEIGYLTAILDSDQFPGLDNAVLGALGTKISTFPGVRVLIENLLQSNPLLEFHIVTTGIMTMLEGLFLDLLERFPDQFFIHGSAFSDHLWSKTAKGSYEWCGTNHIQSIAEIVRAVDKPMIIKRICEGFHQLENLVTRQGKRYEAPMTGKGVWIDPENVCYIGDGTTDLPAYEYTNSICGHTLLVYNHNTPGDLMRAEAMLVDSGIPVDDVCRAIFVEMFTDKSEDVDGVFRDTAYTAITSWLEERQRCLREIQQRELVDSFSSVPDFTLDGKSLR